MAKRHPRDFSPSQWFFIAVPSVAAMLVAVFGPKTMTFPMPLYFVGGGLGLSALIGFVMVYGEDL